MKSTDVSGRMVQSATCAATTLPATETITLPLWFNDDDRTRFAAMTNTDDIPHTQILEELIQEINDEFLDGIIESIDAEEGYLPIVEERLQSTGDYCADFLAQCHYFMDGRNVAQHAIIVGKIELCKLLAEYGCDFYTHYDKDPTKNTPFHSVIAEGSLAFLEEFLLTFNESDMLNTPGEFSYLPIHLAVLYERSDLFDILARKGARACVTDADSTQPIHFLAAKGDIVNIERFLEAFKAQAEVTTHAVHPFLDARDGMGRTSLHIAASQGNSELCDFLLNNNAILSADELGRYPHHYAALNGHADTLHTLLARSEDLPIYYVYDFEHNSLLHCAASCDDEAQAVAMCTKIIAAYPGIQHYFNMQGYSPMHFAAFNEYEDLCNLMLATDVRLPVLEQAGTSVLYTITPSSSLHQTLLNNGANPELLACADLPEGWLYLDEAQNKFRIYVPILPKGMNNLPMATKLEAGFAKLSYDPDAEEYDLIYGLRPLRALAIEEEEGNITDTDSEAEISDVATLEYADDLAANVTDGAGNIWAGGVPLIFLGPHTSCNFIVATETEDAALNAEVAKLLGAAFNEATT